MKLTRETRDAIELLRRAADRQPDGAQPTPAYCWLTDAINHLHGYAIRQPQYRASVLYPEGWSRA